MADRLKMRRLCFNFLTGHTKVETDDVYLGGPDDVAVVEVDGVVTSELFAAVKFMATVDRVLALSCEPCSASTVKVGCAPISLERPPKEDRGDPPLCSIWTETDFEVLPLGDCDTGPSAV